NIHEPISFDDAPKVIDVILKNEVAVLNIEMLEKDVKQRIFDFVSGAIYSLDGKMQKVTKDIFVLVPKGVEIDGKIKDQITKNNGFFQL
ncbi:MAG: cell division protein SepF, partial [Finegoldia magna]